MFVLYIFFILCQDLFFVVFILTLKLLGFPLEEIINRLFFRDCL